MAAHTSLSVPAPIARLPMARRASDNDDIGTTTLSARAACASGARPTVARVYLFRDGAAYQRLRASVDACAAAWIGDRSTLLMVDASPYVLVTDGITDQGAIDAVRAALHEAAGN